MNTYALPALKEKRALIDGRIITLKREIARHQKELANLDATITLFDATYKKGSIKPKRPRKRAKLLKQGELGRHIIDALRRAERPLSTFEATVGVSCYQQQRQWPHTNSILPKRERVYGDTQ